MDRCARLLAVQVDVDLGQRLRYRALMHGGWRYLIECFWFLALCADCQLVKERSEDLRLHSSYLRMIDCGGDFGTVLEEERMTLVCACGAYFGRVVRWELKESCWAVEWHLVLNYQSRQREVRRRV